ncbi:hypothetical protein GWK47_018362 [Chionoecetes opilio]|uniref:Uncharacterized protein n=1 Tax=Chionoecetes opilio TaxID=41210 RepID=A0A8J4XTA9_CHIOP|nr:hypothetical protein GWK47_018362 [Chionoecetes opilio]
MHFWAEVHQIVLPINLREPIMEIAQENNPQFWQSLEEPQTLSTAYHPQSTRCFGEMHQKKNPLNALLRKCCHERTKNGTKPYLSSYYAHTGDTQRVRGVAPFELLFGRIWEQHLNSGSVDQAAGSTTDHQLAKTTFSEPRDIPGHEVGQASYGPKWANISAILEYPALLTRKALRRASGYGRLHGDSVPTSRRYRPSTRLTSWG